MQKEQNLIDFREKCIEYSDAHDIYPLPDVTLAQCFEMPDTGVAVKHLYYNETIYPTFAGHYFDCCHRPECIGTYCTNNGRVAFIYRDGRTFVTRGYKICSLLKANGYKEADLSVPFSNGEEIKDLALRARWEEICNK